MHFMGLPSDMVVPLNDHMGRVFQNVPSATSADWTREVIKFCNGELEMSDHSYIRQDNITQRIEIPNIAKAVPLF
jgi:ABC-type phosphate transport system auxiliary subunit